MSITINVTPAAGGGTFTVGDVSSQNLTLEVTGGIGPPGTDVALAAGTGISISQVNNTATISSTLVIPDNLADLSDVTLGNLTTGQVLEWNGTAWTAGTDSTLALATSAASDLGTAAVGNSSNAARADHVHNLPTFQQITNGTATVTGNLTINASTGGVTLNGGTAGSGSLTLNCENNTHGVTIQGPPHSAAATYTLTLPTSDGAANQVLQTDGSGNLSWANQSAGGGSSNIDAGLYPRDPSDILTEAGDTITDEAGNQLELPGGTPGGPVIQILHSNIAAAVPSSLLAGELAINTEDEILFYANASGTISSLSLSQPSGGGGSSYGTLLLFG